MRGTRTVLASGFLALVLITGSSVRSRADDCLAKPTGPTSQGQHWYYRVDHTNNGRQCWYLRAQSARVQKNAREAQPDATTAMAQTIEAPPQRAAPTAPVADTPGENAAVVAAPIPWLNVQKLAEPIPFTQPVAQQKAAVQAQPDDATSGAEIAERASDTPTAPVAASNRPAPSADIDTPSTHRGREQQRRQQMQTRSEPAAPAIAPVDHTFALLMIMFAALAIAGPALHFVERRRRREAVAFRPPPWARVVALNAPTPRIRAVPQQDVTKRSAPMPIRSPDQTERLAHALQQLVDRLQTADRPEPKAVRVRPPGRASM
jgi:hypothetical protein